jgi:hypothetical protein
MKTLKSLLVIAFFAVATSSLYSFEVKPKDDSRDAQWSGYIYDLTEKDGTYYFYSSCGVTNTPQYSVSKSNVVKLERNGFCYQYNQFYIIYNY